MKAAREMLRRGPFPVRTPTRGLDPARLADADLPGGRIASTALGTAYLAAAQGSPVTPDHVQAATRWELAKTGRSRLSTRTAGGAR